VTNNVKDYPVSDIQLLPSETSCGPHSSDSPIPIPTNGSQVPRTRNSGLPSLDVHA
jgi:hypothetical protein